MNDSKGSRQQPKIICYLPGFSVNTEDKNNIINKLEPTKHLCTHIIYAFAGFNHTNGKIVEKFAGYNDTTGKMIEDPKGTYI